MFAKQASITKLGSQPSFIILNKGFWEDWSDGSAVKNTGSSPRGPKFNSSIHRVAHNHLEL